MATYEQPKTGLGSVEETNRLLQESSKQTGLTAPAFSPTGAITSETLSSSQTPVFVPTPTPSTSAEGLSGIATSYGEQQKALNESLKADADKKEAALGESKTGLFDTMNEYLGIVTGRGQAEKDAGLDVKAQKVTDYTNQLEASQRAQTNELRALDSMGLTDVQRAANAKEINRKYAFEQADLALLQSAANRDYETAFNIVNRKIELQLEPLKLKLDFQKMFYEENKDLFNKAEQREFDALIKATDREYETEKATKTAIANIQLEALKSGITIPQSVLSQLNTARDVQEATAILARNGISLQDPLDRAYKLAQINKLNSESNPIGITTTGQVVKKDANGNIVRDANGNPVMETSPQAQALQTILGSGIFTKDQTKAITNAINNGEDPFTIIKNQAKNIMGQTLATSLDKYETAEAQLNSISALLNDYYAKGGKTNIFTGNYEKTINKLGEVNNPELVSIATNIASALQIYRNAVSGTAYSVQEGKDIASIFPGINKSQGLNEAVLSGRKQAFRTTIDQSYRNTLGSSYDKLKEGQTPIPSTPKEVDNAFESYLKAITGQ